MSMNFLKSIESAPVDKLVKDIKSHNLNQKLVVILENSFRFKNFTPVQAATIPQILKNKDVIVEAKTGSGKTLAFVLPLLELMLRQEESIKDDPFGIRAIILSPTRELAKQIFDVLYTFTKNLHTSAEDRFKVLLIVGGKKQENDIMKLDKFGANIIVATPGRLAEILERPQNKMIDNLRLNVKYFILDEADHLLSVGFEKNLSTILSYLPKQRRTYMFSATQTNELDQLAKTGLRNPIKINLNESDLGIKETEHSNTLSMPDKLTNFYQLWDTYSQKLAALINFIKEGSYKKIVVFLSSCAQVDYFEYFLKQELKSTKLPIFKLHRKLKRKRNSIFKQLKTKTRYIFLATDILCRGIDIPDLHCVIHVDLPQNPESYVHRSGRSGHQLDESGISILMVQRHEFEFVEYCRRKNVVLGPYKLKDKASTIETIKADALNLENKMKNKSMKDERLSTLGLQAFVSFIRFYTGKQCLRQLLFPKLDLKSLMKSFGLTKAPKMPELKNIVRNKRTKKISSD